MHWFNAIEQHSSVVGRAKCNFKAATFIQSIAKADIFRLMRLDSMAVLSLYIDESSRDRRQTKKQWRQKRNDVETEKKETHRMCVEEKANKRQRWRGTRKQERQTEIGGGG